MAQDPEESTDIPLDELPTDIPLDEMLPEGYDPSLYENPELDTDTELKLLLARVRALEEEVDALRGDDTVPDEIPLDLETKVHGYADVGLVGYQGFEEGQGRHPPGFQMGDLLISYQANLDRKVFLTADIVFGLEHLGDWLANLDRLQIELAPSRAFSLTAGKLQSPFGYWSTNIPFGSYLYPTYSRPAMLQFERHGALIATRQTGFDFHGQFDLGFWRLGYHAGLSNGRSPHLIQTADINDSSWFKTTWVQLWMESPNGIQFGVTGCYDPLRVGKMSMDYSEDIGDQGSLTMIHTDAENPALTQDVDEYLVNVHFAWEADRMQLLAEAMAVFHRIQILGTRDTKITRNNNGYLQWSHRYEAITPYSRLDYVEWRQGDPVYQDLGKLKVQGTATVGVRKDIALHAALKAEVYTQIAQIYVDPEDIPEDDPTFLDQQDRDRFGGGVYLTVGF